MDTATLRITFGIVAACVLVLCYGVTYRSTRSAYCGWWCLSLAGFMTATLLWVLDGTPLQLVANPAGNAIGVGGAVCVWAGAASLNGRRSSVWRLVLPSVVALATAVVDHPGRNVWAGGAVYLGLMAALIGLSAYELARALYAERGRPVVRTSYCFALRAMMVISAVNALFYGARTVVYLAAGPDSRLFTTAVGAQPTTLFTLVLLVVVTFSMSALSHEQTTWDLREQATRDGMTGLLNRTEFLRLAQVEVAASPAERPCAVVVADLDRFKNLNDGFGHDAGDAAIRMFADICRQTVDDLGLIGRLGGDEFAVLVRDGRTAEDLVEEIAARLAAVPSALPLPSASFGIAEAVGGMEVNEAITRADIALYQAKAAGRACAVRFDGRLPQPAQAYGARAAATDS